MADNLPPWFLEAVSRGTVNGSTKIPKWFPKPETPEAPVAREFAVGTFPTINARGGYRASQIKPWSHYNDPIVDRPMKGNSRKWGDASPEVINNARNLLIEQSRANDLSIEDTAMVLAIVDHESGFNPDAASNQSAVGLGQFIDATGESEGLTVENRWDIKEQARALVSHYLKGKKNAKSRGQDIQYIYAYHHDGQGSDGEGPGLALSNKFVMPKYQIYLKALKGEK